MLSWVLAQNHMSMVVLQAVGFAVVGRGDGSNKGCVFHLCLFCLDLLGCQVRLGQTGEAIELSLGS